MLELEIDEWSNRAQVCDGSGKDTDKQELDDHVAQGSKTAAVREPCVATAPSLRYIHDDQQAPAEENSAGKAGI